MSPAFSDHGYRMRLGILRCAKTGRATLCERVASSSSASTAFGTRLFTNSSFDSVDAEELRRFGRLSSQWANEEDSFKALHSFNQIRVPWIVDSIVKVDSHQQEQLAGIRVVDVGCGGGLLSIPLARLGASLCGIDASEEAIRAACIAVSSAFHASPPKCGEIHFECSTAEKFAETNASGFDAVVASEIVEHVADIDTFVKACVRLARSGAPLFFTTINKTLASRVFAIWMAEEVFGAVPSGVHDWSKFIEPEVLRDKLESNGCDVRLVHGIAYNPFANKWSWINCTAINYALMAVKR